MDPETEMTSNNESDKDDKFRSHPVPDVIHDPANKTSDINFGPSRPGKVLAKVRTNLL